MARIVKMDYFSPSKHRLDVSVHRPREDRCHMGALGKMQLIRMTAQWETLQEQEEKFGDFLGLFCFLVRIGQGDFCGLNRDACLFSRSEATRQSKLVQNSPVTQMDACLF